MGADVEKRPDNNIAICQLNYLGIILMLLLKSYLSYDAICQLNLRLLHGCSFEDRPESNVAICQLN